MNMKISVTFFTYSDSKEAHIGMDWESLIPGSRPHNSHSCAMVKISCSALICVCFSNIYSPFSCH